MESARYILEVVLVVLSSSAAIGGAIYAIYKFGRRTFRVIRAVDHLHVEFGDSPVGKLIEIIRDIEASHSELQIRQRIVEKHIEVGIYICKTDGKCIFGNDWICEAFGIDSSRMQGFGWLSGIAKEDQLRVHEAWTTAVEEELPYNERYWVDPPHADRWYAQTEAYPVKIRDEVICYVGYVIGISPPQENHNVDET